MTVRSLALQRAWTQ